MPFKSLLVMFVLVVIVAVSGIANHIGLAGTVICGTLICHLDKIFAFIKEDKTENQE